jgi:uncharacterized protein
MKGICFKIYVSQFQKHGGILLYDWLLQKAKSLDFPGGTAFLSLASYGHDGQLHKSHFYELGGGNLTVEVSFILDQRQSDQLMELLEQEKLNLFYLKIPVEAGYTS